MKRNWLLPHPGACLCLLCFGAVTLSGVQSAAPKVTDTQPRNQDQEVAAILKEVVIIFDQDMNTTGYSFTGGGPTFPKTAGKPTWRSARECVLPVQLESGKAYTIGINSATMTSFKSATGVPATPFVLAFKTGATPGAAVPAEKHTEAILQLREAIEHRYSYREVHVVDWSALWKQFEPRLLAARTAREFAVTAGEMLAATQDSHIWLLEGGEIVPAFRRVATPNANLKLLPGLITGWAQKHPMVASGKAAPGVGYIAIHSWDRKHAPQLLDAAFAALAEFRGLPALIVDLRFNSGGDEMLARAFAGCFVRERRLYARHVSLDPSSPSGFTAPMDRWIEPNRDRPAYAGRVAVLMGGVNMSSAEAFLLMMQQVPDCKLIGARSYGASGNPQPHVLANGVTVMLPSWKAMLPDGTVFETKGVEPDVAIAAKAEDFLRRDPVIEKAIELLAK